MFEFRLIEEVNNLGSKITKAYHGFTPHIERRNLQGNTLVMAWLDGEVDYWIVDPNNEGIEQLHEYYLDMIGVIPEFSLL